MGKMNSTTVEEKSIKAEPVESEESESEDESSLKTVSSDLVEKKVKGLFKLEIGDERDEVYQASEFSSTFNPDDTNSLEESVAEMNDSFPIPLNASFDLHALIMVSTEYY